MSVFRYSSPLRRCPVWHDTSLDFTEWSVDCWLSPQGHLATYCQRWHLQEGNVDKGTTCTCPELRRWACRIAPWSFYVHAIFSIISIGLLPLELPSSRIPKSIRRSISRLGMAKDPEKPHSKLCNHTLVIMSSHLSPPFMFIYYFDDLLDDISVI